MDEARRQAYFEKARGLVEQHGWVCQSVFPSEDECGFTYTIGLSKKFHHPEVFVVGVGSHELQQDVLNSIGSQIRDGHRFTSPAIFKLPNFDVDFASGPVIPQHLVRNYSGIGATLLRGSFEAIQLYLPDPEGFFPWDANVKPIYRELQMQFFDLPSADSYTKILH
jgi:hypothetical protein